MNFIFYYTRKYTRGGFFPTFTGEVRWVDNVIRIFVIINTSELQNTILSHLRQLYLFKHFFSSLKRSKLHIMHIHVVTAHISSNFVRSHWIWWHFKNNIPDLKYDKGQHTFKHRNYRSAHTLVNKKISFLFSYHVRELFVRLSVRIYMYIHFRRYFL